MPSTLTTRAKERATFVVTLTFEDSDGNVVSPQTLAWTLTDHNGNVRNSRSNVSLTPASSVTVTMTGADLALDAAEYIAGKRWLTITGTWNSSTYGYGLSIRDHVAFYVDNVKA